MPIPKLDNELINLDYILNQFSTKEFTSFSEDPKNSFEIFQKRLKSVWEYCLDREHLKSHMSKIGYSKLLTVIEDIIGLSEPPSNEEKQKLIEKWQELSDPQLLDYSEIKGHFEEDHKLRKFVDLDNPENIKLFNKIVNSCMILTTCFEGMLNPKKFAIQYAYNIMYLHMSEASQNAEEDFQKIAGNITRLLKGKSANDITPLHDLLSLSKYQNMYHHYIKNGWNL